VDERRGTWRFLVGDLMEKDRLEYLGIDGRIILKLIVKKWDVVHELDSPGSGWGQVSGSCECGNKSSSSIKCGEFLD
jgi:hypothetical protein